MKIVIDSLKQLNYHPMKVYFMLSPKDYAQYGNLISQLNRYTGLTRGIFKFHAVLRGKYFQELTDDLKRVISKNNIIVRLVDDADGNFNYALGRMNFSQDPDMWEEHLRNFMVDVCKHNVKTLSSQFQSDLDNSEVNYGYVVMINGFENAMALRRYKQGVWRHVLNPQPQIARIVCHCKVPTHIKALRDSIYERLPSTSAKEDFKLMMNYFEELMDTPNTKDSDSYAEGAVNQTYSRNISDDYRSRVRQTYRPNITIAIKKVVSKVYKHKEKKAWGVEINIDGQIVPVYIGSTAAAMVYICTLLRQRMGTFLFREIFKKPLLSKTVGVKRHEDLLWIERVYHKLYPSASIDFDDWYKTMKEDSCQFINQGKSASAREINKCLTNYPNAIYYCCVQKGQTEQRNSYYYFDLPVENIIVPSELEELLSMEGNEST
jgi:hypothetical protein